MSPDDNKSSQNQEREETGIYEFGPFQLDTKQQLLTLNNVPVKMPKRAFDLLEFFVENNNQIIDKDRLIDHIWQDVIVEEANLSVQISNLRKILASTGQDSSAIETFPKVGYRFSADVKKLTNGYYRSTNGTIAAAGLASRPLAEKPAAGIAAAVTATPHGYGTRLITLFAAAAAVIAVAVFALLELPGSGNPNSQTMTRVPGTEQSSSIAFSPNGEYIGHAISQCGKRALTMTNIGSGSSVQLLPPDEALYLGMTFSRDNSFLYFVRTGADAPALYRIPVLGGAPVKVLDNVENKISFSPDGDRFCFVRKLPDDMTAIMTARLNGTDEKTIATRKPPYYYSSLEISWSPDGENIAVAGGKRASDQATQFFTVNAETGEEKLLSETKWAGADGLEWFSDGSGLVAGLFETSSSPTQVWIIPYPAGEPKRVTNDLDNYGSVGVSADGKTIMAGQFRDETSLWLVPQNEPEKARSVTPAKHHLFRWVRWTADGRLLFGSSISGRRDLWIMNPDGSGERQLTGEAGANIMPAPSADGRFIVFSSSRGEEGNFNLWRTDSNGSNPTRLTNGESELQPTVTPDGQWVFYTSGPMDAPPIRKSVWKVPAGGGEPVRFTNVPSYAPDISPNGKFVACWYKLDDRTSWKVAVIPIEGGPPIKLLDIPATNAVHWSPDGNGISFVKTTDGVSNIFTLPFGGRAKQETQFTSGGIFNFDWSSANGLICSRFSKARDVVLIRNFK